MLTSLFLQQLTKSTQSYFLKFYKDTSGLLNASLCKNMRRVLGMKDHDCTTSFLSSTYIFFIIQNVGDADCDKMIDRVHKRCTQLSNRAVL